MSTLQQLKDDLMEAEGRLAQLSAQRNAHTEAMERATPAIAKRFKLERSYVGPTVTEAYAVQADAETAWKTRVRETAERRIALERAEVEEARAKERYVDAAASLAAASEVHRELVRLNEIITAPERIDEVSAETMKAAQQRVADARTAMENAEADQASTPEDADQGETIVLISKHHRHCPCQRPKTAP
jgi:hypothetical protein